MRLLLVALLFLVPLSSVEGAASPVSVTDSQAALQYFGKLEERYRLPPGVLAKIAYNESAGNARALNKSTQAGGLFQWIPQYWYGIASKIYPAGSGALNPESRFDPFIAAEVTAYALAYTRSIIGPIAEKAKSDPYVTLYMGHFLGPGGAGKFFKIMAEEPEANAAAKFPLAAQYNSTVFANRTILGLYNFMAEKMKRPGITSISNYSQKPYTGPTEGRMMDSQGIYLLSQPYTGTPPSFPYQDYPSTYNPLQDLAMIAGRNQPQQQTTSPRQTQSVSGVSNAYLSVQPTRVARGGAANVSWTTDGGVSAGSSCSVSATLDGVGSPVSVGAGNQGSRRVQIVQSSRFNSVVFTLECKSATGNPITRTATLTIQ
jgi:hypothetical protein